MLEKTFEPQAAEPRLYAQWEESGLFAPRTDGAAEAYSIVIPPPNVTGSLHIGHALNNTLQDILARYHRMKGKAVLWLPGTDQWLAIDPTNNQWADDRYVTVAWGRDYADVPPLKGIVVGPPGASSTLRVAVGVVPETAGTESAD